MIWKRWCEQEAAVRRMARRSLDEPALRAHAAGCNECQETLLVAGWMNELAALPVAKPPLAAATYLWWKAQVLRQWDAQRKVMEPVEIGEQIGVGVGLAGAGALLIWLWRHVGALEAPPPMGHVGAWMSLPGVLTPVLLVCMLLLGATAALAVLKLVTGNEKE